MFGYTRCQVSNINNIYISSTGQEYNTPYSNNNDIYGSLYLFSIHSETTVTGAGIRLYGCKLFTGQTLVRNFIPCIRKSDNEPGLYDTINNIFYTNQGTGKFSYGSSN